MIVYSYLTGRGRTGSDSMGTLVHAVESVDGELCFETAVCGARPGKRSNGWSDYRPARVTCPKCLKKMAQAAQ
jgi:hypothetical protein